MTLRRITLSTVLSLTLAAITATSAVAMPADRSSESASVPAWTQPVGALDLRSPDTIDAAAGRSVGDTPVVSVVKVPAPTPVADDGFDWGDAGLLLPILLAAGSASYVVQRRRRHAPSIG